MLVFVAASTRKRRFGNSSPNRSRTNAIREDRMIIRKPESAVVSESSASIRAVEDSFGHVLGPTTRQQHLHAGFSITVPGKLQFHKPRYLYFSINPSHRRALASRRVNQLPDTTEKHRVQSRKRTPAIPGPPCSPTPCLLKAAPPPGSSGIPGV